MTDAEVLRDYRQGMQELRIMERQIARWESEGGPRGCVGTNWSDLPQGTNEPEAARMQQLDGLYQLWGQQREALISLGERFERILMGVHDQRLRLLLRCYYGLGMTDESIAQELHMSVRRINTLRNAYMHMLDEREAA